MNESKIQTYLFLAAGSLIVAASFTAVGIHAPRGNFNMVFLGYLLFVWGYKTCWYGVNMELSVDRSIDAVRSKLRHAARHVVSDLWNYGMILLGLYLASYGTVEFAELIAEPGVEKVVVAGVSSLTGYILTHEGVNEVPL
jgi:hypothetical protein